MKVNILMPSYNDGESIIETLNSLLMQTYKNWELFIMDDGSTDNTKEIILNYKVKYDCKNKINYFYQKNQDQLNAVNNLIKYITGDYIFILHSDDLLASANVLEKSVNYMEQKKDIDAIIGDLLIIDKDSQIVGKQKVKKYKKNNSVLALQELWLGRNLFVDVAFYRKDIFINKVRESYLINNIPFWIDITGKNLKMLNVEKVNYELIKYRVFENNYINNEIGKLNVINGEIRTVITIMKEYNIYLYRFQYLIFRLLNKFKIKYIPFYCRKEQKHKERIIKFIIKKRFKKDYKNNLFLNSIIEFYKNDKNRIYEIDDKVNKEFIYDGKDMRQFNKDILNDDISNFYKEFLNNMRIGFNKILVSEDNYDKVVKVCKFMCIYPFVNIIKKEEK